MKGDLHGLARMSTKFHDFFVFLWFCFFGALRLSHPFQDLFYFAGGSVMEAACRSRRRKTRHLGLPCDLHLQTGRALLSLRPRLGPAVSHLLSQIRYRDVPDWRYPQPRVSPVFPGHTCRSIPTDICLRSQTHEKTRWVLDEASSSLSMHSATEVSFRFLITEVCMV